MKLLWCVMIRGPSQCTAAPLALVNQHFSCRHMQRSLSTSGQTTRSRPLMDPAVAERAAMEGAPVVTDQPVLHRALMDQAVVERAAVEGAPVTTHQMDQALMDQALTDQLVLHRALMDQ